jgi:tyrosyl-tRNA synthetase
MRVVDTRLPPGPARADGPYPPDVTLPPTVASTDTPAPGLAGLLDELRWRGLLYERTPGLEARLATGRTIAGYNGFDPSAPSLHVGHLVPVFGLLHLQRRGGRPIVLVGGATGMVGDPSGRSAERNLLDVETLAANLAGIRGQLERFLDFEPGPTSALVVDNLDWLGPVSLLDFLRDVGKHFTVPYMLAKDSVQLRLERGLSFTEFSYMLLQASDYLHLYRALGVELQMGGADQWGNMTAGLELIRRVEGQADDSEPAHVLCYPLLTDASGAKFGKTAEGTSIWLDPARTSPFAFYQWWLNRPDADVGRDLRFFTLLERERIEALEAETAARPEARAAQRALALDITARVHGAPAADHAVRVSEAAFGREPVRDPQVLATLHADADGFAVSPMAAAAASAVFLAETGLLPSRSEARRMIAGGAVTINGTRVSDPEGPVPAPIGGEWWQVAIGKRIRRVGRLDPNG